MLLTGSTLDDIIPPMTKPHKFLFRMPEPMWEEAKRYAAYLNLSVNEVFKLAVGNLLEQVRLKGPSWPVHDRPWTEEDFLRSTMPDQADEILLRAKEDEAEILKARIEARKEGRSEQEAEKRILLDRWMRSRMPETD